MLNAVAAGLALLAFIPLALPALVKTAADRSTNPFTVAIENTAIAIELIVPALVAVLVQWGLVRRRWLRLRGEDDLSRWPWIATMVGGLAILNPFGLDIIGQAISIARPTGCATCAHHRARRLAALLGMMGLESYIRGRMLRRRLAQARARGFHHLTLHSRPTTESERHG